MRPSAHAPAVVLALALLLSGCLQSHRTISHLGEEHTPWTTPEADPWFAVTRGCGFCMGGIENPQAQTMIVYQDGSVLWFHYSFGAEPGDDPVSVEPGLEAWEPAVEAILPLLETGYVDDRWIHVHELAVNQVEPGIWSGVAKTLGFLEERVEDPGPPRYGCEDCSASTVELLGEKVLVAKLHRTDPEHPEYGNYRDGEPWGRLLSQLIAIKDWVQSWKTP